jgi:hypothetical protein
VKSESHFTGAALEVPLLNHLSVSAEQNLTGQAEDEEVCYSFPFIETPGFLAESSALAGRCHKGKTSSRLD